MRSVNSLMLLSFCTVVLAASSGVRSGHWLAVEYPSPLIREEQTLTVNGVPEVWQLKWNSKPKPVCEPIEDSLTCPCTGFAYGEGGDLEVIRLRNGAEIDRLDVSSFFEGENLGTKGLAIVKRWEPDYEKDSDAAALPNFPKLVAARDVVQVMRFADFDHDGWATEFYLQTESLPCGKSSGIIVGISKTNPRLHVFGTALKPSTPLYLQKVEWEALRKASSPVEVTDWPCGDHGAEQETRLLLRWSPKGVEGVRRTFDCPEDGGKAKLLSEEPIP